MKEQREGCRKLRTKENNTTFSGSLFTNVFNGSLDEGLNGAGGQ